MKTRRIQIPIAAAAALMLAALISTSAGAAAATRRVSVRSNGAEADGESRTWSAISSSGRFVAFESAATNLVTGDTNGVGDVFVHDRRTGKTERVSISSSGRQANSWSGTPSISRSGRYVAFASFATNLVSRDSNLAGDVFVHNRKSGKTERVSVRANRIQGRFSSSAPAISANGRFVAFQSMASNLVKGDTNHVSDIFIRDRTSRMTILASVRSSGAQGNRASTDPALSARGRYIAFESAATNLVAGDTNKTTDVFLRDRVKKKTRRVSVSSTGAQSKRDCDNPAISDDGRTIAFDTAAANLVSGDTNRYWDVFVHDRVTRKTRRASVGSTGRQGNWDSFRGDLSPDGSFVAFQSKAGNLVSGDSNLADDIFVRDLDRRKTRLASIGTGGAQGDSASGWPRISKDGLWIAFASFSTNLVPGDTNAALDVFLRGPLP